MMAYHEHICVLGTWIDKREGFSQKVEVMKHIHIFLYDFSLSLAVSLYFTDVIHTVGPIVHGSVGEREEQALRNCYYNCLHTATKNHLRTVVRVSPHTHTHSLHIQNFMSLQQYITTCMQFLRPTAVSILTHCMHINSSTCR